MSRRARDWAWGCRGLKPVQRLVLLALAELADDNGEHFFPSLGLLERMTELSRRGITKATPTPLDWRPGERVFDWASKQGMTRKWVDGQVEQFVVYWTRCRAGKALDALSRGNNVLVKGRAGIGKSAFLRRLHERMPQDRPCLWAGTAMPRPCSSSSSSRCTAASGWRYPSACCPRASRPRRPRRVRARWRGWSSRWSGPQPRISPPSWSTRCAIAAHWCSRSARWGVLKRAFRTEVEALHIEGEGLPLAKRKQELEKR
jgi:hypothetical protein